METKSTQEFKNTVGQAILEIESGKNRDENGRAYSEYHILVENEAIPESELSIALYQNLSSDSNAPEGSTDKWYDIHVIDDITGRDSFVRMTNTLSAAEVFIELLSVIREAIQIAERSKEVPHNG